MATTGRSLELYYIDGRPDGMLTAEMFNWTGHVLMAPRTQIAEALAREESGYAGVYLLLGERDDQPRAYVGEGEDISARIRSHDVNKDWWTSAILVTTAGNKLNKAHVRYLEARLIEEAQKIGRTPLDNGNSPSRPGLSEADIAKMEAFLENILIVLPALRVDIFIQRARPALARSSDPVPVLAPTGGGVAGAATFMLTVRKYSITATAVAENGEFVVQEGSLARLNWEGREVSRSTYADLHDELKRAGVLAPVGDHCVFTENYAFTSASAAAAVVSGRQTNGAVEWCTPEGVTYKAWEADQLNRTKSAAA
jgi:hypothetical protein